MNDEGDKRVTDALGSFGGGHYIKTSVFHTDYLNWYLNQMKTSFQRGIRASLGP